ncbi:MAG: hypothetical protein KatS3mg117_0916 [Geminicoccaceae bacterium]|nr:MAG: hypothetical protein KatS3mg117_0916 [Geminicoccaceae bacterium]
MASMIADAYRRTWADRAALTRAGGLWVLLSLLGDLVAVTSGVESGPGDTEGTGAPALAFPFALIGWIGLSALTVHRVRVLLLEDPPPRLMAPLDRHVVRYILAELVVGALAVSPSLVALVLLAPIGDVPLAVSAGTVAALFVFARLHLALAAAAIGERGIAIERSWRATSRVWPQAAIGLIACSLPLALIGGSTGAAIAGSGVPLTGSTIATLGAYAQACVLATFLAASWRRLVGVPPPTV